MRLKFQYLIPAADTFQQLLASIPLTVLLQSFRDAVLITQKLGMRYLWIDCLCGDTYHIDYYVTMDIAGMEQKERSAGILPSSYLVLD